MNEQLLRTHLAFAVPLRILELRDQPEWALEQIRDALPERLQKGADIALVGGAGTSEKGTAGRTVGAWTTAFALMALQADGGVDFLGLHWCAIPNCRAESRFDHADPDWDEPWPPEPDEPPEPAARPIHTLSDLSAWPPTTA